MRRDFALRAIKGLARHKRKGCVLQTIIPSYNQRLYLQAERIAGGSSTRIVNVWVDLHKLRSRQEILDYQTLRRYITKPPRRCPHVMLVRGNFILWDGNHRVTAAIYRGRKRIRCHVWS